MKQYDAIIIGFGKGGKLLAAELAERNWKVAIVERSPQMYGGTCVNVGCIPTKALIHESEYAEKRYYDDYKNQSKLYALAVARKDKLVSFLREKNYENVKNKPNITLYDGTASFLSENTIRIVSGKDETILEGKEIFINTGSTPILPAIDGLKESKYVYTSETLLQSNKLPAHLLVIGGGDTGSDCIGTSVRQGAASVTQIEIMPQPPIGHNDATPWPQWPVVLKTTSSHEEGCTRRWSLASNRFIGKNGKVCGVEVEEVEWLPAAEGGRPTMRPTGKKEIIDTDMVLLAMGFLKPEQPEFAENVFVAGDAAHGAKFGVSAPAPGPPAAKQPGRSTYTAAGNRATAKNKYQRLKL